MAHESPELTVTLHCVYQRKAKSPRERVAQSIAEQSRMHDRHKIVNDSNTSNDVQYGMPLSGACVVDRRFPKSILNRGPDNSSRIASFLLPVISIFRLISSQQRSCQRLRARLRKRTHH
jgi:hypothetical protein